MDSGSLFALLALVQDAAAAARDSSADWFELKFTIGDASTVGSIIAAYIALRDRLTKLEVQVEPMWRTWNLRHSERRDED